MKISMKYWQCSIVVVLVGMALIMSTPRIFASAHAHGVLSPQHSPQALTIGQESNAWWQWGLSIPTSTNPQIGDYSGGPKCSAGQSGSVWFLAGVFGGGKATRSCTIPAGKTLLFPTFNSFQNNVGNGTAACPNTDYSVQQMWGFLDQTIATVTSHEATVDGVPQQDQRAGPNNSPYSVTVPADNLFNLICGNPPIPAGTYSPNVSDGFYVLLAPLSPGTYTIHFSAVISTPKGPKVAQDVTYHLTVQ
jgi:hypothetical protein